MKLLASQVAKADDAAFHARQDADRARAKATSARNQRDEAQSELAKARKEIAARGAAAHDHRHLAPERRH